MTDTAGLARAAERPFPSSSFDPCIVCGSISADLLYEPTYRGSVAEASDYFLAHRIATAHGTIVRCRDCRFVFTSPRFAASEYDEIYSGIVVPGNLDPSFDAANVARFRRLARIVRQYVPEGATFVDLGCGDGGFLKYMNDPRGRGFEVGYRGQRQAGSSEIIVGDWQTFAGSPACPNGSLDFLTAFDVLEHLPRIEQDVAMIRDVLKPGGLFLASVPDIDSTAAKLMGKRWNMLLLEHLWYFSRDTLARFLSQFGFREVALRTVPYDAPVGHVATRVAQTFGMRGRFALGPLSRAVLPVPAGIMLGVFQRDGTDSER